MTQMTNIPEGYGFVAGRSVKRARALLAAADEIGADRKAIRATEGGYYVPEDVLVVYSGESTVVIETTPGTEGDEPTVLEGEPIPEGAEVPEDIPVLYAGTPTSDWKNADIEAWAKDHGVDLGGATKKADMLAAIDAAADKEG